MMNTRQARVIDPVLTAAAQGYISAERVGNTLFPSVPVNVRGGTVLEFGREAFRLYAARRAPGASTQTIGFGYKGKPFELVQDALNAVIPRELMDEATAVPGVDMQRRGVNVVMNSLTLTLEYEQAQLATNPDNFPDGRKLALAGASKWSDPDSDPEGDVANAKEVVRLSCGVDPNRMVISKPAFRALKRHPKIIERFKYTTAESITTSMLAALLELDMLKVGQSVVLDVPENAETFSDVWGNCGVLAYVPASPEGPEEPSFGYTYTLKGHPYVEPVAWDNDRKSHVCGVTYERKPVVTGIASGFLFQNVV